MNNCRITGAASPSHAPNPLERHGNVAPAERVLPLALDACDQKLLELRATARLARKKTHRHAVATGLRQVEAHHRSKQPIGHLQRDAGAVSGGGIRALATAVLEVAQRGERSANGLVDGKPVQARYQRNATAIVLVRFVVQTDGRRFQGVVPR